MGARGPRACGFMLRSWKEGASLRLSPKEIIQAFGEISIVLHESAFSSNGLELRGGQWTSHPQRTSARAGMPVRGKGPGKGSPFSLEDMAAFPHRSTIATDGLEHASPSK